MYDPEFTEFVVCLLTSLIKHFNNFLVQVIEKLCIHREFFSYNVIFYSMKVEDVAFLPMQKFLWNLPLDLTS